MEAIMGTINSNKFTYNQTTDTFTAEMSELGSQVFHQVYQDSCDLGFELVSDKTGVTALFHVYQTDRCLFDTVAWHLRPTDESIRRNPGLQNTRVIIFND